MPCRDFELLKFDDALALMLGMWIDDKLRALGDDISDYVKVNCIIHEASTMLVLEKEKKKNHEDWFCETGTPSPTGQTS